jgi:hypothetical protein
MPPKFTSNPYRSAAARTGTAAFTASKMLAIFITSFLVKQTAPKK